MSIKSLILGILLGVQGHQLVTYYKKDSFKYSKADIVRYQTLACAQGVLETVTFFRGKRNEPAKCNFENNK